MDKKQYESPEMKVILTNDEDIVTTSDIDAGFVDGDA